ncbi:hypothetical protein IG193_06770 [Infirmifilum lucidum]|uniref:Carboxyltransferase domain-containing protein n=1 Tax=Infirmifilum lucidum TaxID=2776706 RepID=A0A7L9FHH6_9CREN|nr:hypothetical protein [Infirmifilum lucidum]QOJ78453.1 hypothetical protein IG193_06770 [Infirmifilum lucidum]
MAFVVQRAYRALLSPHPLASRDKFAHAVSNVLSLNSLTSPAFELRGGELELALREKALLAVTGDVEIVADGRKVEPWAAFNASESVKVKANATAYVSVRGLKATTKRRLPLKSGITFSFDGLDGLNERSLRALRVPHTLRVVNGDWLESVARVQRHIGMVLEAIKKGAEQVKVRVGGREFEVWVLELS